MFANPIWSLLLLLALVIVYRFIISPRLRVSFAETYTHIDGFWARLRARLYAFRSVVIGAAGVVATALPDLLVLIPTLDLSFLPQPWPAWAMGGALVLNTIVKAFETKPDPKAEP